MSTHIPLAVLPARRPMNRAVMRLHREPVFLLFVGYCLSDIDPMYIDMSQLDRIYRNQKMSAK
jgi:hypothetical protein